MKSTSSAISIVIIIGYVSSYSTAFFFLSLNRNLFFGCCRGNPQWSAVPNPKEQFDERGRSGECGDSDGTDENNDESPSLATTSELADFAEKYNRLVETVKNDKAMTFEWEDSRDLATLKTLVDHLVENLDDSPEERDLMDAMFDFRKENDADDKADTVWKAAGYDLEMLKQSLINAQRPTIDESASEFLEELADMPTLRQVAETFLDCVRKDLTTKPHKIEERPGGLTELTFSNYVNEEKLRKIATRITGSFKEDRPGRPTVFMVNAASGTGKSALLQYCEKHINNKCGETHLALAITFNKNSQISEQEKSSFDTEDGLVLRIIHRFMVKSSDTSFSDFADKWKSDKGLSKIALVDVLDEIWRLCNKKLIVLIDEPGMNSPEMGYFNNRAEETVKATSRSRGATDGGRDNTRNKALENAGNHVWFVFSSLKPVYTNAQIQTMRASGSPVEWLAVPTPTATEDDLDGKLRQYLSELERRMPSKDFGMTLALVKALSGENWAILDNLAQRIRPAESSGQFEKIVYFQNARDILVESSDKLEKYILLGVTNPDMFAQLLSRSIWRQECDLFTQDYSVFLEGKGNKELRLVDLAFRSLVLNAFSGIAGELSPVIPRVSLFAIRSWCDLERQLDRNSPSSYLSKPMEQVLQWAGHNPEDKEAAKSSFEEPSKAFEKMSANLVLAKLIAWKEFNKNTKTVPLSGSSKPVHLSGTSKLIPLQNTSKPLFPYHFSIEDTELMIKQPRNVKTSVIEIDGEGGFRSGGWPRTREKNRTWEQTLDDFKQKARTTPLKLREVSGSATVSDLSEGDIVFPNKVNQNFADYLVILNDEQSQQILLFVQNKLTGRDAETKLTVNDVVSAVELLIRERNVLYGIDGDGDGDGVRNQIAKLNVPEKNVVLCFSVLRQLVPKDPNTFKKNVKTRLQRLRDEKGIEFEGTIVVSEGAKEGAEMFGPSLQNLALLLSSAAMK